ncbi:MULTISPECIES: tRNA 2-thiouridine(34) synthase MnmA [Empedobacter]|uniref:tRNA-specific 2-thiouridylase MnmA n=1 Tax=Empedobacter falsenii TaxID=343874 RepID=A0A376G2W7_9FLAO|nr:MULTISPECIES: tRNA 2-thiouridine(34) synthase MnmA [Empedobacter]HAR73878.1 tRNA 2-thiouridine(34) synthase MnmA [Flavobacteriaceae bacterium]MDH1883156.1 tRNA 2-thiouridine(34) synthase MnmA [Empedobacter sp. GD03797]MDM1041851.1 tRNA 2-thiouridine(34) synthase MnmA [Empedobacter brevis]MDM1135781.1 tRNA 2-thiouridine(34) synthase MnmA [Empedobacter sp. R750]RRT89893.1 tRNA 2-thiouridine(34) synthase MnmA [Empedobacter falsenii]
MKRVVVGLSGGVDSSVTAYLLKEQGYDVIGLFMRNWNDASVTLEDECPWIEDSADALLVAKKLDIPFQVIDMSDSYKERIVDYMFNEYEQGRTPNPDVLCNREIKFDLFLKTALELGADYVATGHYARKTSTIDENGKEIFQLLKGNDNNKDQSYFLCQLSQDQLSKALFPIGDIEKPEVRRIAQEQGLVTANKKDSQGLCFIGKVSLPEFLQQQLKPKEGVIVEIAKDWNGYKREIPTFANKYEALDFEAKGFSYKQEDGEIVGKHQGAHYFTRGQRKGLGVGGKVEPLFIIDTDVETNVIYTGQGADHSGLLKKALFIKEEEVHWVREDLTLKTDDTMEVMARIRYRQPLQKAILHKAENGMYVEFENPQSAITEGQFCAWYVDDELLGSGVINN